MSRWRGYCLDETCRFPFVEVDFSQKVTAGPLYFLTQKVILEPIRAD